MTTYPNAQGSPGGAIPVYQAPGSGTSVSKNVHGAAAVVKAAAGSLIGFAVLTAGTTAGTINDCAATGDVAVANQIATIPNAVGYYSWPIPASVGLVVTPGNNQVIVLVYQ